MTAATRAGTARPISRGPSSITATRAARVTERRFGSGQDDPAVPALLAQGERRPGTALARARDDYGCRGH